MYNNNLAFKYGRQSRNGGQIPGLRSFFSYSQVKAVDTASTAFASRVSLLLVITTSVGRVSKDAWLDGSFNVNLTKVFLFFYLCYFLTVPFRWHYIEQFRKKKKVLLDMTRCCYFLCAQLLSFT